jgi:hypothetical protein
MNQSPTKLTHTREGQQPLYTADKFQGEHLTTAAPALGAYRCGAASRTASTDFLPFISQPPE